MTVLTEQLRIGPVAKSLILTGCFTLLFYVAGTVWAS